MRWWGLVRPVHATAGEFLFDLVFDEPILFSVHGFL